MKKKTQEAIILDHLKKYGSITTYEAFINYRITRLSGRIFDLKRHGADIVKQTESTKDGTRYAVYYLKGAKENV